MVAKIVSQPKCNKRKTSKEKSNSSTIKTAMSCKTILPFYDMFFSDIKSKKFSPKSTH